MKRIPVVIHAAFLPFEVWVPRTTPVFIKGGRCAVLISDYGFTAVGNGSRIWHQQVAGSVTIPIRFGHMPLRIQPFLTSRPNITRCPALDDEVDLPDLFFV